MLTKFAITYINIITVTHGLIHNINVRYILSSKLCYMSGDKISYSQQQQIMLYMCISKLCYMNTNKLC
jgi:hypothetical protein